ncbi:MAG: acetyl-CoA carboxylase biotin carboxylase subunit [Caldilineaceae bacterium]|nr:acetyl-CoA carboxylase biotin carboxylase subunit [Caldilineaceae bacterium]
MFTKILIANRGEIAVRIIRACQEMGVRTVAVYSEADAGALHTALTDEAVCIGPPPPGHSYLRGEAILAMAVARGCQAVHPGYGFLSENADFAQAVADAGLIFIGPSPDAMRRMGSKTSARATMMAAGVPVVPGFQTSQDDADLVAAAQEIGFPLLVKATAGGGGKGMRLVHRAEDLIDALHSARREAQNAFGDDHIYLEKYLVDPHHIEFQVFGDQHGHTVHLFERECSVQRRHQKIIEETPSPLLNRPDMAGLRERMGKAAVAAAQAVNYVNAGTIEFLVTESGEFYFLEMNTRLQVEHPITEEVTGVDLVKLQLRVAAGEALPFAQTELTQRGHAIECRIYAEDPSNDFLPAIGPVLKAVEPVGPGVRVDAGITSGDEVTLHYDPMIAKLVVLGQDRADAVRKMDWALSHYAILGPLTTNIPFLRDVLAHPTFVGGNTTTQFIDQHFAPWQRPPLPLPDIVLIAAALCELKHQVNFQTANGDADPDNSSPWAKSDGFRMGKE